MSIILDGTSGVTTPGVTNTGNDTVSGNETITGTLTASNFNAASSFGFKNRIINGAMVIDQRNAGASVTITANPQYTVDRWFAGVSNASKISVQQSSTAPSGFTKSMLVTSLAATTPAAGDVYYMQQSIEGFNVADLDFGLATAKTITISFWVRSSLTGTFGAVLLNAGSNRSFPFNYTISAANTWTQITQTIAGDTTGTWATDNTTGFQLRVGLGAGSTYQGVAGSWGTTNAVTTTTATNVVGTNGATFYITGVQLEVGSKATTFDTRAYGQELALCQRYFYKNKGDGSGNGPYGMGHCRSNYLRGLIHLPVIMRTTPTMTNTGTDADYIVTSGTSDFTSFVTRPSLDNGGNQILAFRVQVSTGMTNGYAALLSLNSSSSYLDFSAEL